MQKAVQLSNFDLEFECQRFEQGFKLFGTALVKSKSITRKISGSGLNRMTLGRILSVLRSFITNRLILRFLLSMGDLLLLPMSV